MSLFPDEDILTQEIESWKGFADSLPPKTERRSRKCLKIVTNMLKQLTPKPNHFLVSP